MKRNLFLLLLLCLLPFLSQGQRQLYLLYNQTYNSVLGHQSSNFEGKISFEAGGGYRHYFNNTYSLGGEISLTKINLLEQVWMNDGTWGLMDYRNDLEFLRLDVPLTIQIHYPRWHYGFGIGGSVLLHSNQKQTFTPLSNGDDQLIVYNFDNFPFAEAFIELHAGVRILPKLSLNLQYYQGINDIGRQYGWKKNIRFGLGLSYSLSPNPKLESRSIFTSDFQERTAAKYKITENRNIIRHNVRQVSDHPNQVNINISSIGAGDSRIINIDLESSSGDPSITGTRAQIERAEFPLFLVVTYVTFDVFLNNTFECVFRIEIYEPGNWEIFLQQ